LVGIGKRPTSHGVLQKKVIGMRSEKRATEGEIRLLQHFARLLSHYRLAQTMQKCKQSNRELIVFFNVHNNVFDPIQRGDFEWIVHHEENIECIITSSCLSNLGPAGEVEGEREEEAKTQALSLINLLCLAAARGSHD
jgi:hypothetical protein